MSHEQFLKWLMKIGTGWLGWSPSEVRNAHMQEVILAYEGKIEMLKACFGGKDDDRKMNKASSVEQFDQMFGVK